MNYNDSYDDWSSLPRCVGYMITINNPLERNYTHSAIKTLLEELETLLYYCFADEIGGESGTYHTHIYALCKYGDLFQKLKNLFPHGHIEKVRGTPYQCKNYVKKTGVWKDSEKSTTCVPNTFEEFGIINPSRVCRCYGISEVTRLIKQGLTDYEIFRDNKNLGLITEIITLRKQLCIPNPVK